MENPVEDSRVPIAVLEVGRRAKKNDLPDQSFEPIYGGYANARGEVSLFGARCAYRVNLKTQTLRQRPSLNPGAQANYDAVEAGEPFLYANVEFLRLSHERIAEICASGAFRITI
ncbi:MAG TPA: hypothetical protein VGG89_13865 [Candidatus Baltobacteraceae bacterium]